MTDSDSFNSLKVDRGDRVVGDRDIVTPEETQFEKPSLNVLRPRTFNEYPGQDHVKTNLKVFVEAALKRQKPLDHVILHGPPGLGKTTLAHIVANELGAPFYNTSGPSLDKPGNLAGILVGLKEGSLLFIDEIHRLSIQIEEVLYSAMEDFSIDLIVGQGQTARSVNLPVAPFTLVGATTKLSSLSRPFLSRFGIQEKLDFYDSDALAEIIRRSASILSIPIEEGAAFDLARRSRGTPRIANRLLKRVYDFASLESDGTVNSEIVAYALARLDIDEWGLDKMDREILSVILHKYSGGPVGIETIAVTLGEERATLEEVYEPFLIHSDFIVRTPRGRCMTDKARRIIK